MKKQKLFEVPEGHKDPYTLATFSSPGLIGLMQCIISLCTCTILGVLVWLLVFVMSSKEVVWFMLPVLVAGMMLVMTGFPILFDRIKNGDIARLAWRREGYVILFKGSELKSKRDALERMDPRVNGQKISQELEEDWLSVWNDHLARETKLREEQDWALDTIRKKESLSVGYPG